MRSKGKGLVAKQTQVAVPRLRFPEFKTRGVWKERRLGEVISFQAGFPFPSAKFSEQSTGLRLIRNRDLRSNSNAIFFSGDYDERYVVSNGDVLIGMDGDFTPHVWQAGRALLNQRVGRIIAGKECNLEFAYYLLSVRLKAIEESTAKTTVKHLSHSDVEKMEEPLPILAEQEKIAGCMSSLDACIGAETRKLDALKAHRHGLMQQLFPAEGERTPLVRLPGFKGEWQVRKVGEMMQVGSSKRVHESDWSTSGVAFYRARELVALAEGLPISPLYIDEQLYEKNVSLTGAVKKDHLLVTGVGSIGVPYLVRQDDRFYFKDGNIIWLKNDESTLVGSFLHLAYLTPRIQDQITLMAGVGTVGTYTIDSARRTEISFPVDKVEQQRIADCLFSLDNLINAQSHKIAALREHKKGLMQGLFPAMEKQIL